MKYILHGKLHNALYLLLLSKSKHSELMELGELSIPKDYFSKHKGARYIPFNLPVNLPKDAISYVSFDDEGQKDFKGEFYIGDFYLVRYKRVSGVRSHGVFVPWYDPREDILQEPDKKCIDEYCTTGERVTLSGEGVIMPFNRLEDKLIISK